MTKKTLIVLAGILIIGFGIWYYLSRPVAPTEPSQLDNILPFGSGGEVDTNTSANGTTQPISTTTTDRLSLFKISDVPVAGAVAINKGGQLTVRYVERATGHIMDVDPVSLAKTQIVNTTVPKVYEAIWKEDGSAVVFRTLRDGEIVESNTVTLTPPTGTSTSDLYTVKISALPANISELAAGANNIFYSIYNAPQITSSLFDGSRATTVWSSPFNQWQLHPGGSERILMTTKPSVFSDGYSYILATRNGDLTRIIGPRKGLVTKPNSDLSRVAYSYLDGDTFVFGATTVASNSAINTHPLTIASKCAWSNQSPETLYCGVPSRGLLKGEPDIWIQGVSRYSDSIWRLDIDSGYSNILLEPEKEYGVSIDIHSAFVSPNDEYLFFINRNDLALWALKLD